ncbi:MAG: hypothetical protein VX265_05140 [Myxococcota bacterium]|nr:hypothetical protein [Myxococcota bacterium]MEC8425278.1 hypothetical protein [Myxococcota bacterium]
MLSFAAVPTQRLSEERLRRYRNAVPPGGPEVERFADATECATTARGRACIIEVPGHETIAVGEDEAAETLFTLGSSGAFSVVAINASGRHLAYGLRYDKLEGQPVKLFLVDLERIRDPTRPVDGAVRVITRGALGPPGPPNAGLRAAMAAEHNPLDGQVAAYCQVPVRLRARQPDARPDVAAYHFPCHLPASTAQSAGEDALPLALADIAFGPTDLRMIAMVASALPPATPTPPAPGG